MNILIDIGHPAHVHYYRNLASELSLKGHHVIWTIKDIEVVRRLLDFYGHSYIILPRKADGLVNKALRQLQYDYLMWRICRERKIDLAIGTSATVTHVSTVSTVKSIVFDDDDDDVQPLVTKFVSPFADTLISPDALKGRRRRKDTLFFPGYMELAYLHPKRFSPEPSVLNQVGVEMGESFIIMRFNVFKAHHDVGVKGLSLEQKMNLVEVLKPHGKIFITTERNIEPELKQYQMTISPEKVHSLMAYAKMFIGDSQTMTSEAALLGIPGIKCNSFAGRLSVPNELEEFGLCFSFIPDHFEEMKRKIDELLSLNNLKEVWNKKCHNMLSEKIDVTAFMLWLTEDYPNSAKNIEYTRDFWSQFK
jgi:predicted glycosyltransferase